MNIFLGLSLVGVWIVIATVALISAYGSPGPSQMSSFYGSLPQR
jgi:hypothetical protein